MTTGKTIALTRRPFVGKVMSLLFNMLSRLVITFLPRSYCLLLAWLQSLSAVILEPPQHPCQNKVCHCFPIYLPWSDGTGCRDLSFLNVEFSANFFTLLFHFHQEALEFFFALCTKCGVILLLVLINIIAGTCFIHSSTHQVSNIRWMKNLRVNWHLVGNEIRYSCCTLSKFPSTQDHRCKERMHV